MPVRRHAPEGGRLSGLQHPMRLCRTISEPERRQQNAKLFLREPLSAQALISSAPNTGAFQRILRCRPSTIITFHLVLLRLCPVLLSVGTKMGTVNLGSNLFEEICRMGCRDRLRHPPQVGFQGLVRFVMAQLPQNEIIVDAIR